MTIVAIYHCSIKNIGRSNGRSAIASASYRSGEELYSKELGKTFNYTQKRGIEHTEIILCKHAPREYQDRATLWNAVEAVEKSADARLCREWEVAIPKELSLEEGQELVRAFGQSLADEGMCIDIAIHDKGDSNRHAHILGTTRAIKENGEWANKAKKVYDLDENGERIPLIDPKTGQQKVDKQGRKQWKCHKEETVDWNRTEKVEEWRARWATLCNRYLSQDNQITHLSHARRGLDTLPTIHEGYKARKMEQDGLEASRTGINREIKAHNRLIQELKEIVKNYGRQILERIGRGQRGVCVGRGASQRECPAFDRQRGIEGGNQPAGIEKQQEQRIDRGAFGTGIPPQEPPRGDEERAVEAEQRLEYPNPEPTAPKRRMRR